MSVRRRDNNLGQPHFLSRNWGKTYQSNTSNLDLRGSRQFGFDVIVHLFSRITSRLSCCYRWNLTQSADAGSSTRDQVRRMSCAHAVGVDGVGTTGTLLNKKGVEVAQASTPRLNYEYRRSERIFYAKAGTIAFLMPYSAAFRASDFFNCPRARDRRDITVPIGISRITATSL